MEIEGLATASKTVGTKQTLKAVAKGQSKHVFIAQDADRKVIEPLLAACEKQGTKVHWVENMQLLGVSCGVKVGTAAAAILD